MTLLAQLIASPTIARRLISRAPEPTIKVGDFLALSNLDIYIEDGIATLCGHAGTESDREIAEDLALRIDGVIEVRNYTSFS